MRIPRYFRLRTGLLVSWLLACVPQVGIGADPLKSEIPVPWVDGERMHFTIQEKDNGPVVGDAVFSIADRIANGEPVWRIQCDVILDQQAVSVVEVDKERFLPTYSFYKSNGMGEVEAEYANGGVSIEHRLKNDRKRYKQSDKTYDIHQSCYLMRQFPIEIGYQSEGYMVNSKRPMKQVPTVMKIVSFENLHTPMGEVSCYRVDVKMAENRRSFWFGTDERRLLYRIEESSGTILRLMEVDRMGEVERKIFRSEKFGYSFSILDDCFAFVREGRTSIAQREYVVFMLPDITGEFSMIRHHKFGELDEILKGSIQWLVDNRQNFRFFKDSQTSFQINGYEGISFEGEYLTEAGNFRIYNAILMKGESLYIFTGNGPAKGFEERVSLFDGIVKSMHHN